MGNRRAFRSVNKVRTDTLETLIAVNVAKNDPGGEAALRRLAERIGAPIREDEITKLVRLCKEVVADNATKS